MDAVTAGILLALVALIGSLTVWGFSTGYSAGFSAASLEAERGARKALVRREEGLRDAEEKIAEGAAGFDRVGGGDLDRLLSGDAPLAQSQAAPAGDSSGLES